MALLVVGLILWVAAHLFKRLAPGPRQALTDRMGDASKGVFAGLILASVVLIVLGYRGVEIIPLYTPIPGIGHLSNLLMLIAIVIYSAGMSKGVLWTRIRHPQLQGFSLWAVAHLLVNGDLASVLLFGTLLVWAQVSILIVNAQDGAWIPPKPGALQRDLVMVAGALVAFAVIAGIHMLLGLNPFVGTYG